MFGKKEVKQSCSPWNDASSVSPSAIERGLSVSSDVLVVRHGAMSAQVGYYGSGMWLVYTTDKNGEIMFGSERPVDDVEFWMEYETTLPNGWKIA